MDAGAWVLAIVAAAAVDLAKGGLMMVGMIAVPVLSLAMSPVQAAGILLPVYVVSDMGGLAAFRRSWDGRVLAMALPGALAGIALGWATAALVPERAVAGLVGLIGVVFAVNALVRPSTGAARGPDAARGSFWGFLAGFTSFVSHSGAPPWQVYAQPLRMPPMVFAGTTTVFFAVVNAAKLLPYWALGQLAPGNLRIAAVLLPVAVASVWVGLRIVRVLPAALFYRLVTWALLLVSLKLLWDAVV